MAKNSKGPGGHHRPYEGATDVWLTPPEILAVLGEFDLDPCPCPAPRPWPTAKAHYDPPADGLKEPYRGRVFMNPPYGPHTGRWLARLADHGQGTALIFARTETVDFFAQVWERATALFFLRGRIHFYYPDGSRAKFNAGAPSVLVAYGEYDALTLEDCDLLGQFVRLRQGNVCALETTLQGVR